jgi:RHS repeat-associated protein
MTPYVVTSLSALARPPNTLNAALVLSPFKAHPFADPFTTHDYVRARWLDRASGTWLSPDPLAYRDSADLYTYCGGDSIDQRDPTGLYEADFHYGVTLYLALRAGFTIAEATEIATATELPDQMGATDPLKTSAREISDTIKGYASMLVSVVQAYRGDHQASDRAALRTIEGRSSALTERQILELTHFPGISSGPVRPASPDAQRTALAGVLAGDLRQFGWGLHPLQDSFSHSGVPSLADPLTGKLIAGHPEKKGGLSSHAADQPQKDPVQALAAAHVTYAYLVAFRVRNAAGGATSSAPWPSVEADLRTFVTLPNVASKKAWLSARGASMPANLWSDVTDLPPTGVGQRGRAWARDLQEKYAIAKYGVEFLFEH